MKSGLSEADSKDLAQNVLIDFWKRFSSGVLDQNKNVDSYLFRRAKWRMTDYFRRNKESAERHELVGEENNLDILEGKSDKNLVAYQWQVVNQAIKSLKNEILPRHLEFFVKRTILGEETSEIAKTHNTNASSVYLSKHRVMKRVIKAAKQLAKDGF